MKSELPTKDLTANSQEKSNPSSGNLTKSEENEELDFRLRIKDRRQTTFNKLTHIHDLSAQARAEFTEELAQLDEQWEKLEGKQVIPVCGDTDQGEGKEEINA